MTNHNLLQAQGLSRCYGENRAVDAVSFTLERGQILGFLGANGAGKSTTLRMLAGVLAPDAGLIVINGADLLDQPRRAKQAIGYLPEQPPLYRELTVDEQLHYSARIHGLSRAVSRQAVAETRTRCGLNDVGRRLIGSLSKGYRQRVGIAQAILHKPPLILLDEPTVGLDPMQALEIRALIGELGQENHGVILSTHLLAEVQAACTHVQIMHSGRLVYRAPLADLRQQRPSGRLRIRLNAPPPVVELAKLPGVTQVDDLGSGQFRLHHDPDVVISPSLLEQARIGGWSVWQMTPEPVGLEQVFVDLMLKQETGA